MDPKPETTEDNPDQVLGQTGDVPIVDTLPAPGSEGLPQLDNAADLMVEMSAQSTLYAGFDPQIHAANPDGTPKFKAGSTTVYQKKRGRKSATAIYDVDNPLPTPPTEKASEKNPDGSPVAPPAAPKVNFTQLGKVYAGMFFGATTSIIGPEWAPQNPDEKKHIENAFASYAQASGAVDLPPGWALVFALGFYSAARFQHENTQSKFAKLKDKFVPAIAWLKGRFSR